MKSVYNNRNANSMINKQESNPTKEDEIKNMQSKYTIRNCQINPIRVKNDQSTVVQTTTQQQWSKSTTKNANRLNNNRSTAVEINKMSRNRQKCSQLAQNVGIGRSRKGRYRSRCRRWWGWRDFRRPFQRSCRGAPWRGGRRVWSWRGRRWWRWTAATPWPEKRVKLREQEMGGGQGEWHQRRGQFLPSPKSLRVHSVLYKRWLSGEAFQIYHFIYVSIT